MTQRAARTLNARVTEQRSVIGDLAVDGGHGHLGHLVQDGRDVEVLATAFLLGLAAAVGVEVRAGAEASPRARELHDPHLGIVRDAANAVVELPQHGVGNAVQPVRPGEGDGGPPALRLVADRLVAGQLGDASVHPEDGASGEAGGIAGEVEDRFGCVAVWPPRFAALRRDQSLTSA